MLLSIYSYILNIVSRAILVSRMTQTRFDNIIYIYIENDFTNTYNLYLQIFKTFSKINIIFVHKKNDFSKFYIQNLSNKCGKTFQ